MASSKNTVNLRVCSEFEKMLREVSTERVRRFKDNKNKSPARLSLALTRVPRLKDILMEAKIDG